LPACFPDQSYAGRMARRVLPLVGWYVAVAASESSESLQLGRRLSVEQLSRISNQRLNPEASTPRKHLGISGGFAPGTLAESFTLQTLSGQLVVTPGTMTSALYAMAWNTSDPFTSVMWTSDASVQYFVDDAPENATFLFLAYANSSSAATATVTWMQSRLNSTMLGLGWSAAAIDAWLSRAYFCVDPVQSAAPYVSALLQVRVMSLHPKQAVRASARRTPYPCCISLNAGYRTGHLPSSSSW
jgi:hypothetical protein